MKKAIISLFLLTLSMNIIACGSSEPTSTSDITVETETQETETLTGTIIEAPVEDEINSGEVELEQTINDTDTQYKDGYEGELNVEPEEPAETQPQQTSKLNFSEEERQWYKDNLGLTDEQLNTITEEELGNAYLDWMHKQMGSSSGTSGGSGSSGNSGGSSGGNGSSTEDDSYDPGRDFELDPDDGSLPGGM